MTKNSWMMAAVVLVGCGATDGTTPWDQNHDGLISACEGLNHDACVATPGCEAEPVYCTMECRDDGHGGCLPCAMSELCRPVAPPPVPDCSALPVGFCQLVPACEVVTAEVCPGGRGAQSAEEFVEPEEECNLPMPCEVIQTCVNRQASLCESLSPYTCLSQPGCALTDDAPVVCPERCADDGQGGCEAVPCMNGEPRCVSSGPVYGTGGVKDGDEAPPPTAP